MTLSIFEQVDRLITEFERGRPITDLLDKLNASDGQLSELWSSYDLPSDFGCLLIAHENDVFIVDDDEFFFSNYGCESVPDHNESTVLESV